MDEGVVEGRRRFPRQTDGQLVASNTNPAVVYSTSNKNLMANNKIKLQCLYLWANKYLAFHCQPFIVSFIKAACFLWAILSARHLSISLPLHYSPACLWDPFSYLFLSGSLCSALVMLVLKRSVCVITTRPDLKRRLRDKGEDRCKEKDFRQI